MGREVEVKKGGALVVVTICSVMALPILWSFLSPHMNDRLNPITQRCIALFSQALVSPASLDIVHIREYDFRDISTEIESPPFSAYIEFDSANAFGALIRGQARCAADKNGEVNDITLNGEPLLKEELMLYQTRLDVRSR